MRDAPLTPQNGSAANPKRRFKKRTYVMDGQPILLVLEDAWCNHRLGDGMTVESVHNAANNIKRCKSGVAMFRMCGIVFDIPHTVFPTVDQQFKMLQHYADNHRHLLFDGWRDVIVQKIKLGEHHSSVNQKPCIREVMKGFHFTHVAFPSLAFTYDRNAIPLLVSGLGVRGRTVAVLDQGIDTLTYPDQLAAYGVLYANLETTLINRLHKIMSGERRRFGWERVAGRYVPNVNMREKYKSFAKLVDRRFGKTDPIPLDDYKKAFNDGLLKSSVVNFGRLHLDAIYLLTNLNFPMDGTINSAKVIIESTGYRRSLGRRIDYEHARSLVMNLSHGDSAIQHELAIKYAGIFQHSILQRCQQGYMPDFAHPSVLYGAEHGEPREAVSAKYGKRQVWRDVARTALGIVESIKETRENTVVRRLMKTHFLSLIEKANEGIIEQASVFSMPKEGTHELKLYREIAKNEDALRMFSVFAKHKHKAEEQLRSLVSQFPEWGASILGSWEGFLKNSLEEAKELASQYDQQLVDATQVSMVEPDPSCEESPIPPPCSEFSASHDSDIVCDDQHG